MKWGAYRVSTKFPFLLLHNTLKGKCQKNNNKKNRTQGLYSFLLLFFVKYIPSASLSSGARDIVNKTESLLSRNFARLVDNRREKQHTDKCVFSSNIFPGNNTQEDKESKTRNKKANSAFLDEGVSKSLSTK